MHRGFMGVCISSALQYVAVAAGMNNAIMGTKSGPASVVIYALPDKGGKQKK